MIKQNINSEKRHALHSLDFIPNVRERGEGAGTADIRAEVEASLRQFISIKFDPSLQAPQMLIKKFLIYRFITLMGDLLLLNGAFFLAWYVDQRNGALDSIFLFRSAFFITALWIYLGYSLKLYNRNRIERFEQSFSHLLRTIVIHILGIVLLVFSLKNFYLTQNTLLLSYLIFAPADFLWRLSMLYLLRNIRSSTGHFRKAVIIGSGAVAVQMQNILRTHKGYGYKVLGVFSDNGMPHPAELKITGNISEAKSFCEKEMVEDVFCALPLSESEKISDIMSFTERHLMRFKLIPDFTSIHNRPFVIDYYGFVPVLSPTAEPLSNVFNSFSKRVFDIIFSSLVIVLLLSWLIPLVSLMLLIESGFPVFYRQNRSGLNYQTFRIFKFRTMRVVESDEQFVQAKKDDPRITPLGRFLRKYNIDELPQFLNVFIGDMSVVGPRPHPLKLNEEYRSIISKYMIRHLVKPGVTGMAQAKGFRGETADKEQMEKRIISDVFYIENWSFLLDIKIILLTVINIFKGDKNAF